MNNIMQKIFGSLGSITSGKEDGAVGIDIGSSAIKVVEIKKKGGKTILETYGAISLGPYGALDVGRVTNLSVEKISEALKEVLKQSGVTTTGGAFSIPIQSSLIFTVPLPITVKESEMAAIIPTEARKYIPVPITEVSLDYFILPKKESSFEEMNTAINSSDTTQKRANQTNVLVVATQNDAISKYRSIISQASLTASFFEIEIFSSIRSNFEHELSPVLLMDLGASRAKLSIVEFGMVKSYHTIDRGGADITDSISKSLSIPFDEAEKMKKDFGLFGNPAEKSLADIIKIHIDYIFSETNNALLEYEKRYNRTISKVIFTGGGALLKGLSEVAINNFRAEIEIGHPMIGDGALCAIVLMGAEILKRGVPLAESFHGSFHALAGLICIGLGIVWWLVDHPKQWGDIYHHLVIAPLLCYLGITLLPVIFKYGTRVEIVATIYLIAVWAMLVFYDWKTDRLDQRSYQNLDTYLDIIKSSKRF